MLNVEIKFLMAGKEGSLDSFVGAMVQEIREAVREEISRALPKNEPHGPDFFLRSAPETPRQAVSIREAARLLSISPRTVDKYVASKVIPTVRVGRRVLVPMKSVNDITVKGFRAGAVKRPLASKEEGRRSSSGPLIRFSQSWGRISISLCKGNHIYGQVTDI